MNKPIFRKGNAGLGILLICSFGAILLAGWSFSLTSNEHHVQGIDGIDSMRYQAFSVSPYNRTWWAEGEDSSGIEKRPIELERKGEDELKLSLPNVGLREPDEINWPYKDGFTYDLVQGGHNGYSVYTNKGSFKNTYATDEFGGRLEENFEYKYSPHYYTDLMVALTETEFDTNRKVKGIHLNVTGEYGYGARYPDELAETPYYEISVVNQGSKINWIVYDYNYSESGYEKEKVRDVSVKAPEDGFYIFSGSDTPGLVALMLSALELDGDEPASVWVLGGGNFALWVTVQGPLMYAEPIFTRVTIYPLDECPTYLKRWWNTTREFFYDWEPDELRTYILFEEGANYLGSFTGQYEEREAKEYADLYRIGADIVVAYLDDKDRLVRIEQIGSEYCTAAELVKIGTEDKWWGSKTKGE